MKSLAAFRLVPFLVLALALPLWAAEMKPDKPADFDMHAPYVRYHFQDNDMDFTFGSVVLGSATNGGVEIGEAFAVAARIKDGDAASWQQEWLKMAGLVEERGEKSLSGGHKVSAMRQFMRASNYYRFGLLAMMPDDPRLPKAANKSRELMRKAGKLMDPPLEYFEVPFEGTVLPCYFRAAKADGKPRKTLLMLGGGETFAEDLIFYIMPQALERGYNFITADLPGQGIMPLQGKYFRAEMHKPVMAIVDKIITRKEIDKKRLAVYGISGGGGFAPQAAQHDARLKAVVVNSCVVDAHPLFASMTPVTTATAEKMATWKSFHANTVKGVAWRWNVPMDNIPGLVDANKGFAFTPSKLTVPLLSVVGEGEYNGGAEVKRQQKLCIDGVANANKRLIVTPLVEGASNHCIMENRSVMAQEVFDWLDSALK
ncbi:MAG: alpha/beta hydrolase [Humidesulfovibrio sp.]|uniref:alpha/beta hydrolase family protein n=1 Tax=Humidesulfovibrio sp. TaxID=2910988 RepID=UPI0027EFA872|nr:alpha/beta hydrolase [Humidesulfovibrio sp.]MDQ7836440.1 alpha/beta hydrolase [Humidesulfovibrio sp.]